MELFERIYGEHFPSASITWIRFQGVISAAGRLNETAPEAPLAAYNIRVGSVEVNNHHQTTAILNVEGVPPSTFRIAAEARKQQKKIKNNGILTKIGLEKLL